jgi:hypothetical protein
MKKLNSKFGQASLEFIIIFVFTLVIVSLALYVIGFFTLEFSKQEATLYRNDVANLVIEEFELYEKVESGYLRNIEIPAFVMSNYNITLNQTSSLMIIYDFVVESGETPYYYNLPLGVNFNSSIDIDGNLIITLNKNLTQDLENILII